MVKIGSGSLIAAIILWYLGYIGIFFESFIIWIIAFGLGTLGAIILFIGVLKERIREKEEEKEHDYREY